VSAKDFFISYNRHDKAWAEWVAWILEEAEYSVVIQAWDFRPGSNFVLEMHAAVVATQKTIAILSANYFKALFTQPEWAAAFADDPTGAKKKLVPIRIDDCEPPGLLKQLNYIDIHDLGEEDARRAILGAFSERAKPLHKPKYPRDPTSRARYPGEARTSLSQSLNFTRHEQVSGSRKSASTERLELMQTLNSMLSQQFNMLVFALNPPPGLIPPMPAPQADRVDAILRWSESLGGCGLPEIRNIVEAIVRPSIGRVREKPATPEACDPPPVLRVVDSDRLPRAHAPLLRDLKVAIHGGVLEHSFLARAVLKTLADQDDLELDPRYDFRWVTHGIRRGDYYAALVRTEAGIEEWQQDLVTVITPILVGIARGFRRTPDALITILELCATVASKLQLDIVWPDGAARDSIVNELYDACCSATDVESAEVYAILNQRPVRLKLQKKLD
jgi:hypothetical protein